MTHEVIGHQSHTIQEAVGRERSEIVVSLDDLDPIFKLSDALLEGDRIYASTPDGPFGRGLFGRDSTITAAIKAASYRLCPNGQLDQIIPPITALHRFIALKDLPSAGIRRGDLIHENRTVAEGFPPDWFAPGGIGFNYDELDGPDRLIILDYELIQMRPALYSQYVESIELMVERGIRNAREYQGAGYVRASEEPDRLFPGITDKRWRDGYATTVSDDLSFPPHPIRPVEEQALRWSALQNGADLIEGRNPKLASQARETARFVQQQFINNFVYDDAKGVFIADAVDAYNRRIHAITTDQILVLLHEYDKRTILDDPVLQQAVIRRSFDELFSQGGFKTVSENGPVHPGNKYQGPKSRWPHASAMAVQAIDAERKRTKDLTLREELLQKALQLGEAMLDPLVYFGTPVEAVHVTDEGEYTLEYDTSSPDGKSLQYARIQAWSGAGGEFVAHYLKSHGKTHITVTNPTAQQAD